jgi:hypothetical protein
MRLAKPRSRSPEGRRAAPRRSLARPRPPLRLPAPPAAPAFVTVDYPRPGERVVWPVYTIRLSVLSGGEAEISIDDEAWMPCREAAGFWWHDWSGYGRGAHKVCARITLPDGRRSLSECRSFIVELP